MADIRDPDLFLRGRWAWNACGYEAGFPRKCAFTDVDAVVEFDGRALFIEAKYHDGIGPCDYPDTGQMILLRRLLEVAGASVFVVYGDATWNSPQAVRVLSRRKLDDEFLDWRGEDITARRASFKWAIDRALGIDEGVSVRVPVRVSVDRGPSRDVAKSA